MSFLLNTLLSKKQRLCFKLLKNFLINIYLLVFRTLYATSSVKNKYCDRQGWFLPQTPLKHNSPHFLYTVDNVPVHNKPGFRKSPLSILRGPWAPRHFLHLDRESVHSAALVPRTGVSALKGKSWPLHENNSNCWWANTELPSPAPELTFFWDF